MNKKDIPNKLKMAYSNLKHRCYNHNLKDYKYYGGKGIKVYKEWLNNKNSFFEWALNNGYDDTFILGRKDINKDYSPDNCQWITFKEQQNNRTNNVLINIGGISKTASQWSEEKNINKGTLFGRLYNNEEDLFKEPTHITVKINGKIKTLTQLSEESGIARDTIYQRYKEGWKPKKLTMDLQINETKYITINNEIHTITEWAKISGLTRAIILNRIQYGWKNEDLLKPKTREGGNKKYIEIDGESHIASEWCEIANISLVTFYRRLKNGLTGNELIAPPTRKTNKNKNKNKCRRERGDAIALGK